MSGMTTRTEPVVERINELRTKRQAVILVHNYQRGEIQDIGDLVGDSLELSRKAARTDAKVILFCGVHFMAETAKILSPEKMVLMPDPNAGCPMANMLTLRELKNKKAEHPEALVVCYVNSAAEIKAESDICCTSANADKIVASIPEHKEIIFIPDKSLGDYVARKVGRELILWPGFCPTHHRILREHILQQKKAHPAAKVIVHPECTRDVIGLADAVGSTSQILRFARETAANEVIVGTENGMLYRLAKENPDKKFYPASPVADCPNMRLNTLEKVFWSLEDMVYEITVPEDVAARARGAIERMLELS
ncbi:MAG: quinolinate synthetase [Planctomycetes bacterium DG_23]|nr:MAG: quinolinate synthetase [Planctomycetes bacterium DG_23]